MYMYMYMYMYKTGHRGGRTYVCNIYMRDIITLCKHIHILTYICTYIGESDEGDGAHSAKLSSTLPAATNSIRKF